MLYEELLASSRERLERFFRNVPLFENHFQWSDYNAACYRLMYAENDRLATRSVKDLKSEIPELAPLCRKCAAFFLPARNESIPKYDVLLGKQLEEALMEFLSEKLNAKTGRADLEDRSLPDCKILKPNGEAAAYFEVKFHGAPFVRSLSLTGRYCYEGSATLDFDKIEKQLARIEEKLPGAPVFYVHWVEYPCLKGVFYETSDQVKRYIREQHETFERKRRAGDDLKSSNAVYLKKMYSPLLEMHDFDALLSEFDQLIHG